MKAIFTLTLALSVAAGAAASAGTLAANDVATKPRMKATDAAFLPADKAALSNAFWSSPEVFNKLFGLLRQPLLQNPEATNSYFQLIKDLNLNFKGFNADTAGGDAALGFDYSFEKALLGRTIGTNNPLGLSLTIHAKGNVAFSQKKNPDDFLDTGVKFHLFQSLGGWEPEIDAQTKVEADELTRKINLDLPPDQRAKDPDWQEWQGYLHDHALPQFFWDAAGNFSLESNQDFSQKQSAYGLQIGGIFRALNHEQWGGWNLLDYPFAAIRYVTGADQNWRPSSTAYPMLLAGLDLVDPFDNDARLAVDPDKDAFPRLRAEAAFKTRLLRLSGKDYWLSASYRFFQELGASSAIRSARQDEFHYFAAMLDLPAGFNVSYSTGRLPLDGESDRVVALGWKLNF